VCWLKDFHAMPGISDTIINLARMRATLDNTAAHFPGSRQAASREAARLIETTEFGSNPGALRMLSYVPDGLAAGAPLVVVLHGCTQSAASYDHGSGWSQLAARHGFALLFPEQQRGNNANLCFNWFQSADVSRTGGEAESIQQMIRLLVREHRIDPARVYVTGLSAGGAMTASLLACFPEVFAGGAIIAGLPHGAAVSIPTAFEAMSSGKSRPAAEWGDLVREAAPYRGPRPAVQIWQGTADTTVRPSNATELVKQWSNVHGVTVTPDITDLQDGARHEMWRGPEGRIVLETYLVPGMAHGTPLDTGDDDLDHSVGHTGPHMLAADIGSTWHIARSWGLLTHASQSRRSHVNNQEMSAVDDGRLAAGRVPDAPALPSIGAKAVIEKALRAAGLMGHS